MITVTLEIDLTIPLFYDKLVTLNKKSAIWHQFELFDGQSESVIRGADKSFDFDFLFAKDGSYQRTPNGNLICIFKIEGHFITAFWIEGKPQKTTKRTIIKPYKIV